MTAQHKFIFSIGRKRASTPRAPYSFTNIAELDLATGDVIDVCAELGLARIVQHAINDRAG